MASASEGTVLMNELPDSAELEVILVDGEEEMSFDEAVSSLFRSATNSKPNSNAMLKSKTGLPVELRRGGSFFKRRKRVIVDQQERFDFKEVLDIGFSPDGNEVVGLGREGSTTIFFAGEEEHTLKGVPLEPKLGLSLGGNIGLLTHFEGKILRTRVCY